jgi:hypothetical protein
MRLLLGLCVVGAIGFGTLARASQLPAPSKYTVHGIGTASCASWITDNSARSQYGNNFEWVLGFVSGAGWQGVKMRQVDSDNIRNFVDHYCVTHPLDHIADAAAALVDFLKAN